MGGCRHLSRAPALNAGDAFLMPGVPGSPAFGVIVAVNEEQRYVLALLQNQSFVFIDYETAERSVEHVKTFEIRQ